MPRTSSAVAPVAVSRFEQVGAAGGDDAHVALRVLGREPLGERIVPGDDRGPGAGLGIGPEGGPLGGPVHHALHAVLPHEAQVGGEARLAGRLPAVSPHRPVEDHASGGLRIVDAEGKGHRAAHASPHDERRIDAEMVQELFALACVRGPRETFHPSAGLSGLPAVVGDDLMFRCQPGQRVDAGPGTGHAPLLDGGIETAGREHQQRRSRAAGFIVDLDTVDDSSGHWVPPGYPVKARNRAFTGPA